jgi:hypothetical protein
MGMKRQGRANDHSPPSSAEVKECVELYLHSPNTPLWRGAQLKKHRDNFTFLYYNCLPAWGLEYRLKTPSHNKKIACYETIYGTSELVGFCEHGNEPTGSIRGGVFLDYLSDSQLLKDYAP